MAAHHAQKKLEDRAATLKLLESKLVEGYDKAEKVMFVEKLSMSLQICFVQLLKHFPGVFQIGPWLTLKVWILQSKELIIMLEGKEVVFCLIGIYITCRAVAVWRVNS